MAVILTALMLAAIFIALLVVGAVIGATLVLWATSTPAERARWRNTNWTMEARRMEREAERGTLRAMDRTRRLNR